MRRLPKGLKKVSKSDFVNQLSIFQKEKKKNVLVDEEIKQYDEWSKVTEKKPHRQTYRW